MEATTIPSSMALAMDFPYFRGFRFCIGILDIERVSMTTRVRIVRFERSPASNTSPGNQPQKLVIIATNMAAIIMNALLVNRVIAFIDAS
jgi:hypothetical protein